MPLYTSMDYHYGAVVSVTHHANAQPDLESNFEVGGYGFPALVAFLFSPVVVFSVNFVFYARSTRLQRPWAP